MAFDPPLAPELELVLLESREIERSDRPPQNLVEAQKKEKRRRRKKKKQKPPPAPQSTVPREIGGPMGYMSKAGIWRVYEWRRRHGISMDLPVTVTEFMEATDWRIPRAMVHRSAVPKEVTKRPTQRRPSESIVDEPKKQSATAHRNIRESLFLREESEAISDVTTFDPSSAARRRHLRPLPLNPVEAALVLSPIPIDATTEVPRRNAVDTEETETSDLAIHLQRPKLDTFPRRYAEEGERIQRTRRRTQPLLDIHATTLAREARPQNSQADKTTPIERPHRIRDTFDRRLPQDRPEEPWHMSQSHRQIQQRPRTREPADIWEMFQEKTKLEPLGNLPRPPSAMRAIQLKSDAMSSRQSATSFPKSEKTLEFSDFDESSKTPTSEERLEIIRAATKADKELLDRLLHQDSQRPPLDYI